MTPDVQNTPLQLAERSYSREVHDFLRMRIHKVPVVGEGLPNVMKDPCAIVKDGQVTIFGTQGDDDVNNLGVLVLRSETLFGEFKYTGQWITSFQYEGYRPEFCAPGGLFDPITRKWVFAIQTRCFGPKGEILFVATDDCINAHHIRTLITGELETAFAVIYDPHLFMWENQLCMTFNAGYGVGENSSIYWGNFDKTMQEWVLHLDKPILTEDQHPLHAKEKKRMEY